METFLLIATTHFLALLSPGPDFFLIVRQTLAYGWRSATGACLGIALANGLFITAAFTGTALLRPGSLPFAILQWVGAIYLCYLGILFLRHAGASARQMVPLAGCEPRHTPHVPPRSGWWHASLAGFLSGFLNPKNMLFYASLAAMLTGPHASPGWKLAYGVWMFSVVLLWDVLVAVLIGRPALLRRFALALPWIERLAGVMMLVFAAGIVAVRLHH